MTRIEIINSLIKKYNYASYLEIGCQGDVCFNKVECKNKVGVDPESGGTFRGTSDLFFKQNQKVFDIIFIDGMHQCTQVWRDIQNSLGWLTKNGTMVLHDMLPESFDAQVLPRQQKVWNGDCWMAMVWLRATTSYLNAFTIATDCGIGIIQRGVSSPININCNITYANLMENMDEWLNLKSVKEFQENHEWLLTS